MIIVRVALGTICLIGLAALFWVLIIGDAPAIAWLVGMGMAIGFCLALGWLIKDQKFWNDP